MIDGTKNRYVDEMPHLRGMDIDAPLYIPTEDEYYAATGRVLIKEDFHQYFPDTPFNLVDGPPPAVLGTFQWSTLWVDNMQNVDLTQYFTQAQIANDLPYRAWRVRGLWRGGYMAAFYGTMPQVGFSSSVISAFGHQGDGFQAVSGGYALGYSQAFGNMIQEFPVGSGQYYFMGGPPGSPIDHFFPTRFQVEVGYGSPNDGTITRLTGGYDWPAFSAGVTTDLLGYRAFNPNWACFNGFANAPNVIALGGCPYTGQGGYVPPDPPEDL